MNKHFLFPAFAKTVIASCVSNFLILGLIMAQGWQQSYPTTSGYSIETLGTNFTANLKNGLANSFFTANGSDGSLVSLTPSAPDCDLAPYGVGDLRVSSTEFFDRELTTANDLRIRRLKLTVNTCTISQTVFDQTYDLPVAEAVYIANMAYEPSLQALFIGGTLQLTPIGSATQYRYFIKKINAMTGAEAWSYQSPVLTIPGFVPNFKLWLATFEGGVVASRGTPTATDINLLKLDANGQLVFDQLFGSPLTLLNSIAETVNGDLDIRTFKASVSGPGDAPGFQRMSATGSPVYQASPAAILNSYLGSFQYLLTLSVHIPLINDEVLLVGKNSGTIGTPGVFLIKLGSSGQALWTKFYPGLLADFTHAVQTADGGFLLGGKLENSTEVFLMKTDANGEITPPATCAGNLLSNPGFESGLTGWSTSGDVTISTVANTGINAAKVGGMGYGSVGQVLPTTPGKNYKAKVWAKSSGDYSSQHVEIRFLNASFMSIPLIGQAQNITQNYSEQTLFATAPGNAAYVYALAWKDGSGSIEVDDWCLTIDDSNSSLPDLTVTNLQIPSVLTVGTSFNLSCVVQNIGTADAPSTELLVNALPNSLAVIPVPALAIGQEVTINQSIAVPLSAVLGQANLYAQVDAVTQSITELSETNNYATAPVEFVSGGSGQIDLSLVAQQLTATPAQWSNYPVKLTISNSGPQTATGVKVKFAKPNGVVYVGGNEFTASQGTFNPNGDEVWTVGNIPANGSATLTVNYFLLNASAPVAYAQVTAANETDSDSSPGNGTPPSANEDDEASTGGGGPPNQTPDLTLANLQIPNSSVAMGAILNYNFDAANIGTGAVPGNFTIKSYISTDQTLSANDIQDGTIPTGNYGVGFSVQNVAGASTIPASLAAGQYYLIVKIDADNAIAEGNENNNTIAKLFTVTGSVQNPDLQLSLETDASEIWPNNPIFFVTATVKNTGAQQATGVEVTLSGLQGAALANSNFPPVASQGAFNQTGQIWNVGTIAAGGQAALKIFLYNEYAEPVYRYFAQVSAMNEADVDSTPGNASCCTPNEDDEAVVPPGPCNIQAEVLQVLDCIPNGGPVDELVYEVQVTGSLGGFHGWYGEPGPVYSYDGDAIFERTIPRYETRPDNIIDNADPKCSTSLSFPKPDCDPCSSITITPAAGQITIAGAIAPHVLIKVFKPNWQLAFECLDNCPNPVVVDGLANGNHYVQVKLIDAGWGEICYLEQTVNVSSFGGGNTNALVFKNKRQRLAFDKIYPNPAQYFVTLEVYSKDDQSAVFDFYDQMGRAVHQVEMDLKEGLNELQMFVGDWKSGTYNVIGRGEAGLPAYGRFLKVWEE
ncbi:MAG: hypothetical protein H6577_22905 [Lewinellaceae bacterium]|nr:hypothetical protein [Saprospiraceae bacterium]MCB9340985.1 hypothetical protein [Lewinellaceae bacterium]